MHDFFGPVIHSYSRADAINDGILIDLSLSFPSQCSMYRYSVACTADVWALITQGAACENGASPAGIVWEVIYMSQHGVITRPDDQTVLFDVIIPGARTTNPHRLKAQCHAGDQMEPVITIMLPDED